MGDAEGDLEVDNVLEGLRQHSATSLHDLTILTLNLHCYAGYPRDPAAGQRRLTEMLGSTPPDVICIQEGLEGTRVLEKVGYRRVVSSGDSADVALPMKEAVYHDPSVLEAVNEVDHGRLMVNEIYVRSADSSWEPVEWNAKKISSDMSLTSHIVGDGPRSLKKLANRSVVWVKLARRERPEGPYAFVMNAQITGGEREDVFFVQHLADERRSQLEAVVSAYKEKAGPEDIGILAGSLAATTETAPPEPLSAYFASAIETSRQVQTDAEEAPIPREGLKESFKTYISAPFGVLREHGWHLAYNESHVGATDDLGRLVDHMATSRLVPRVVAEPFTTTNPREGYGFDFSLVTTDVPLADHNAVKATFGIAYPTHRGPSYQDAMLARYDYSSKFFDGKTSFAGSNWSPADFEHFAQRPLGANLLDDIAQRSFLERVNEDLRMQSLEEQEATEKLQAELSTEMGQLRYSCKEEGQTIASITQKLADAQRDITAQLHDARNARAELEHELESERAANAQLEASHAAEHVEVENKIEMAEQQLAMMHDVRGSLEAQIRTSEQFQSELHDYIGKEKDARRKLEDAGTRELETWKRENDRLHNELSSRIAVEKAEVDTWRSQTCKEITRLQEESRQNTQEASELRAMITKQKKQHHEVRSKLQEEAVAWHNEAEELRVRCREVDEQCEMEKEAAERHREEMDEYREARAECQKRFAKVEVEERDARHEKKALEKRVQDNEKHRADQEDDIRSEKKEKEDLVQDLKNRLQEAGRELEAKKAEEIQLHEEITRASRGPMSMLRRLFGADEPLPSLPQRAAPPSKDDYLFPGRREAEERGPQPREIGKPRSGAPRPARREEPAPLPAPAVQPPDAPAAGGGKPRKQARAQAAPDDYTQTDLV